MTLTHTQLLNVSNLIIHYQQLFSLYLYIDMYYHIVAKCCNNNFLLIGNNNAETHYEATIPSAQEQPYDTI